MKRKEQSDFSYMAERVSRISEATLQKIHKLVKTEKGENRAFIKPPFCTYVGDCPDKRLRKGHHLKGFWRRYQLCTLRFGECNQQSEAPIFYEVP